ncbi:hypothetical protein EYF80_067368 [Liparis tanakae]|uniref:Uncharacterized protein n=1 Tax=Liparis tanakae TaxID=230148 RepID=A0A4Z2E1D5_9TELE|nr:hypothetical protein EYF80_067368 [Liparis tanakae]
MTPLTSAWMLLRRFSFSIAVFSFLFWRRRFRLFISPSSSGADRLSELKLLSSRARKRFSS